MTTKKLSEETEQNPSEPHSLAVLFKVYIYGAIWPYSSCHKKHPMNVHGWVFTLYLRFCVWPLSGKNILFFTFNRSVSNAQFFFCQIYVCNVTNRRIKKNLEENLYVCTLKLDLPFPGSVIKRVKYWNAHKASRSFQSYIILIVYQNIY